MRESLLACSSLAVLILAAPLSADRPVIAHIAGLPFEIGMLDSASIKAPSPRLFVTPDELDQAKARIEKEPAAKAIADRAVAKADQELDLAVGPIDESWWQAAKDKPWEQTYPEVFQNTMLVPARFARAADALAMAWLLTDQDKYADKAVKALMNLAPYSFQPVHYDVGMNYSVWALQALRAYELLTPKLSTEQRKQLDGCMTRLAHAVARNDVYWIEHDIGGGINNHLAWHKMMLGLLGLFYGRQDMVDYCLTGRRGLVPLLVDGLVDDGLWCESSLIYQFAAIAPMIVFADCQQRMGRHPGLHEITAANSRTLRQSFDAMFNVLAPDLMIPPIGDAYGARQKLSALELYEYCWTLWGDSRYAWLINQNPERSVRLLFAPSIPKDTPAPSIGTLLRPEHGYALLRSHRNGQYWNNPDALCAFLTYDRSSVHANADKLSLMLFGQGRMLLSDVEGRATVPHAFSSRIQGELNRGGLSQNTVMIDGADQRCVPELLQLVEFRDLPDEKRVTAADTRGLLYEGVHQMRTVVMTPDYVLDVFQVNAGPQPRQIDWIMHVLNDKATLPAKRNPIRTTCEPFELPKTGAWHWLREARSFQPKGPIELEWEEADARLHLHLLDPEAERVVLCGYPATDQPDSASIPMVIVRNRGRQAIFAAVWLVGDRIQQVRLKQLPDHEAKLAYEVTADAKTRQHLLPRLGS